MQSSGVIYGSVKKINNTKIECTEDTTSKVALIPADFNVCIFVKLHCCVQKHYLRGCACKTGINHIGSRNTGQESTIS